ncbi:MAG TPA: J domain-containing protein [Gemmatimonadaceae bacterium]|nr:J domain-containing protein [Gemmatimonadaceae bacterium]
MAQKDFYNVLGVSEKATADEIKKQYRRLAKQYHPDTNKGDAKSAERFKEISEAYQVLGDEKKRKQYDEMRRLGAFENFTSRGPRGGGARGPSAGPGGGFGGAPGGPGGARYEEFDIGGLGGLGDLFSSMFGGGGRQRAAEPEQGQSVETTLEIPFRVAATGGKVPIELEVNEECHTCHGTGAAKGAKLQQCPECGGRGTISFGQGGFAVSRPCPMCLGKGTVPTQKCPTCGGAGEQRVKRKININVPSGTDTGTKMRLKGQGGRGLRGGPAGDVILTFQVKPDPDWERDGLDLVVRKEVNVAQATLGSKVSVETLDEKKVSIRIPAGTPSGKRFRVRGQGIEKDGKHGDLLVEVAVVVPERLTAEQERLMKEFAEAAKLEY